MDRLLAERIMASLHASGKDLNTVSELIEEISDAEEKAIFRRGIATVMAYIYSDLELPIINQYQDLDPDG